MFDDKDIMELYNFYSDVEWRMDNLYYIKDKFGKETKFTRNDSQMRFWRDMWYLNLILKDRQRGFSTLIAIFILDQCQFNSDTSAGIIDITLPDAKKKLAKISYAYHRLPNHLKEANPLVTDAKESMEWSNGSSVSIGTSHRGGTLQLLHISEMGKIAARNPEVAREIRTGALNTVAPGCYIFNESTAEGNSGAFFDDCQEAQRLKQKGDKLTKLDYRFHFFPWYEGSENELDPEGIRIPRDMEKYFASLESNLGITLSPRKKAWYVKKQAQQRDDMWREYPATPEEAFKAAIDGAYLSKQLATLRGKNMISHVAHDPGEQVNSAWDFGLNDQMCIWFHQRVGLQHRLVGYLAGTDEDVLYYWGEMQKYPFLWGKHYLPHDAGTRRIGSTTKASQKPKTLEKILNKAGMRNTVVVPRVADKRTGIQESKQFLVQCWIDMNECEEGIKCLQNFRREWDEKMGTWKRTPRHDWAMHGYDAFETLARGFVMFGDNIQETAFAPRVAAYEPLDTVVGI